jgi:hypothetical protein
MRPYRVLILLLAFIGVASKASAGPILYSATFDTVSAHYFTDPFLDPRLAISSMSLESSTGVPALTANFLNDKQLTVTYSAPPGHKFVFNPPLDADTRSFTLWLGDVSGIVTGPGQGEHVPGVSIDFAGAEGNMPVASSFEFVFGDCCSFPGGEDNFAAFYRGSMSGPFAFQSVTAVFTVPAAYDHAFNAIDPVAILSAAALWSAFVFPGDPEPDWTDPGVWASIEPIDAVPAVPEPSTLILVLSGISRRDQALETHSEITRFARFTTLAKVRGRAHDVGESRERQLQHEIGGETRPFCSTSQPTP